uniref:Large ribosomal subunit protein bL20 n=1 Tax=candidate division WOR-3 bacterium TaxID=2052148 RepID=A0A7C3N8S2_UNCW3
MTRVKNSPVTRARRKKWIKRAAGSFGKKSNAYKSARSAATKALVYAYRDRKKKKSEMRSIWITRINIACREHDISYSKFINGLKKSNVLLDRKQLSEIAIHQPDVFKELVKIAKSV